MDKKLINELNRARQIMGLKLINEQEEEEVIVDDEVDTTDQPSPDDEGVEQEEQEDKDVADEELTDEEVAAVVDPEKEETWLAERWEDLTDEVRNIFSRNKKFFGCRGKGACPTFNKMSRRRKRRMISRITIQWPKIRFRIPWQVKNVFSEWKRKRAHNKMKRQHSRMG